MRPSAAAEGLRRAHSLRSSLRPWHRRFAPHAPATKSLLRAGPPADSKVFARKDDAMPQRKREAKPQGKNEEGQRPDRAGRITSVPQENHGDQRTWKTRC